MTLEQVMSDYPAVAAQIRELENAAYERGKAETEKAVQARIETAKPYLSNGHYPEPIRNAAARVIEGTKSAESLQDMVDLYDVSNARAQTQAAQAETTEAGETKVEEPEKRSADGVARSNADIEALKLKLKGGA